MQASSSGRSGPEDFERELRRVLYRFDCPDAQVLGEYELDLLDSDERIQVAAHASECEECHEELNTLRAFLAMPTTVPEPTLARVRRFVATLFTPSSPALAYGGLRGAANGTTRVFEAQDVTVTVGRGQNGNSLLGLVVVNDAPPDVLDGHEVRLFPRGGLPMIAQLDDLGNFEFLDVPPGVYLLEIDIAEGVLVVEELQVD